MNLTNFGTLKSVFGNFMQLLRNFDLNQGLRLVYDLSYPDEKKILVYFEQKGEPLPKINEIFFLIRI